MQNSVEAEGSKMISAKAEKLRKLDFDLNNKKSNIRHWIGLNLEKYYVLYMDLKWKDDENVQQF